MYCVLNDDESVFSESTIDSEIVQREVEEYERNQRLRRLGLLPYIQEEERQIDYIESMRNCNLHEEQNRFDDNFFEDFNENSENLSFCDKSNFYIKRIFTCFGSKKLKILTVIIIIFSISIGGGLLYWMSLNQGNEKLSVNKDVTTEPNSQQNNQHTTSTSKPSTTLDKSR